MSNHTIIVGDARAMPELKDRSVHLVVTSPPYWQIKDYGARNQIGFHDGVHLRNGAGEHESGRLR